MYLCQKERKTNVKTFRIIIVQNDYVNTHELRTVCMYGSVQFSLTIVIVNCIGANGDCICNCVSFVLSFFDVFLFLFYYILLFLNSMFDIDFRSKITLTVKRIVSSRLPATHEHFNRCQQFDGVAWWTNTCVDCAIHGGGRKRKKKKSMNIQRIPKLVRAVDAETVKKQLSERQTERSVKLGSSIKTDIEQACIKQNWMQREIRVYIIEMQVICVMCHYIIILFQSITQSASNATTTKCHHTMRQVFPFSITLHGFCFIVFLEGTCSSSSSNSYFYSCCSMWYFLFACRPIVDIKNVL